MNVGITSQAAHQAAEYLKSALPELSEAPQHLFRRMYSPDDLSRPINEGGLK